MLALPADDRRVIGNRFDRLFRVPDKARVGASPRDGLDPAAVEDVVGDLGALEFPRIGEGQPFLGIFLLPAVLDDLAEEAVVVADTVAISRNAEARHAFEEAGGEPAETAITERRIRLGIAHPFKIDAKIAECAMDDIVHLQIAGDVVEQSADQKLKRQVINVLAAASERLALAFEPAMDDAVA